MTPTPTPKTKVPTASAISRLLSTAGFTRAVSKLRGGVSGFDVSKYGDGEVEVRYASVSMGTSNEYRYACLAQYAKTITEAGFTVETDPKLPRLIVTAKEG